MIKEKLIKLLGNVPDGANVVVRGMTYKAGGDQVEGEERELKIPTAKSILSVGPPLKGKNWRIITNTNIKEEQG